ncbi:unnamed protein product [Phytophthora fragariaefolia]|uniref:Unnamed protein product n=1 Tax=Phytophthora fragariaefolia TaxID=1490495 RepID=A0A9W7DC47_9STRA|nr:unnamed protein product [Phytophthora fragariaefolia]
MHQLNGAFDVVAESIAHVLQPTISQENVQIFLELCANNSHALINMYTISHPNCKFYKPSCKVIKTGSVQVNKTDTFFMFCKMDGYTLQASCKLPRASHFGANSGRLPRELPCESYRFTHSAHIRKCRAQYPPPRPASPLSGRKQRPASYAPSRKARTGERWPPPTTYLVQYHTARRAVLAVGAEPKQRGSLRASSVKMTVEVMSKLEELIDEDCRMTLQQLGGCLQPDLGVDVSVTSVHHALQGMLYSTKRLRIQKKTMNSSANKDKP